MGTLPAAKVERWQRFRDNRNKALAARHGWLTLTSFAILAASLFIGKHPVRYRRLC